MDENDIFISQRVDPKLALVVPHFEGGKYLCLDAPGMKTLKLNIDLPENQQESKRILNSQIISSLWSCQVSLC